MNSCKVSIVVPVYNVQDYLEHCIQSLVKQTYDNIEIILVDDGSTDNSGVLCDEYATISSVIRVVHKENGGLSDARNAGLLMSTGDYVLFVDSDDYISFNAVEKFMAVLFKQKEDVDVIIGKYICVNEDEINFYENISKETKVIDKFSGESYLFHSLKKNKFMVTAWSKLYRRDFLLDNKLFFEKGIVHEDELFTIKMFMKADNVLLTDLCFYNYVQRLESITTSKKQLNNARSIRYVVQELDALYNDLENKMLRKELMDHSATIYYQRISGLTVGEMIENHFLDYSFLFHHSYSIKNKLRFFALLLCPGFLKYMV